MLKKKFKKLMIRFCIWYFSSTDLKELSNRKERKEKSTEPDKLNLARKEMEEFLATAKLDNLYGGLEKDLEIINLSDSEYKGDLIIKPLEDLRKGKQTTVGHI